MTLVRPPETAYAYSGGGTTNLQLALTDIYKKPYDKILNENFLGPVGMANSTFSQPLSAEDDMNAARGHDLETVLQTYKWKVYPELAAAGLWTTPTDLAKLVIEVQLSLRGESNRVLTQEFTEAMLLPAGIGSYAIGFSMNKHGEGWYFGHGGSNRIFLANMSAHKLKGYGAIVMTNSVRGGPLMTEIRRRIQEVYAWDSLDTPVAR